MSNPAYACKTEASKNSFHMGQNWVKFSTKPDRLKGMLWRSLKIMSGTNKGVERGFLSLSIQALRHIKWNYNEAGSKQKEILLLVTDCCGAKNQYG